MIPLALAGVALLFACTVQKRALACGWFLVAGVLIGRALP